MGDIYIVIEHRSVVMCEKCKEMFQLAWSVPNNVGRWLFFYLPLSQYCLKCNPQLRPQRKKADGEKTMSEGIPT